MTFAEPSQQEFTDMIKRTVLAASVAAPTLGVLPFGAPANAAVTVKAGILTCNVGSGWGFVFGSSRNLNCTYSGSGWVEHYAGDISKFGVDIGYLKGGVITWAVVAPTVDPGAGALGGNYGGVTGGASMVVGGDANVLIGGSNQSISLQPVSRAIRAST